MHQQHCLGDASRESEYYKGWTKLLSLANAKTSNSFWACPAISFKQQHNVLKYRTGTLYTQKHALMYGRATHSNCLLCHRPDSQIHLLSGCQHDTIRNMFTEQHNVAARIIAKAISKGALGGNMVYTDIGSTANMTEQGLPFSHPIANRTLPQWLLPHLQPSELKTTSRPDIILVLPKNEDITAQAHICTAHPSTWEVHLVEIKYCDDTRPDAQLKNARVQHSRLMEILRAQGCRQIKMHTILLGVVGTIYKDHTDIPLGSLGLDHSKIKKVAHQLHIHSIQYATKIVNTRHKLSFNLGKTHRTGAGSSQNPPDPH